MQPLVDHRATRAGSPLAPSPGILGVGGYVPSGVLTNADLEQMVATSDTWILERTGIRERRIAGSGETTSSMGAAAARIAIQRAGDPAIDAIVVATITPETLFPSAAVLVGRRLGLAGVPAFDLNAACTGFLYGLVVADGLVRSGAARHVLLVAAEAMTTLVDYGDRSTCVLFGDGAGAVVIGTGSSGGIRAHRWGADGREADLIHYGPGLEAGGSNHLQMRGRGTFRISVERMVAAAAGLLDDTGWTMDEVAHVVPHQANIRIINAVATRLRIPSGRLIVNAELMGNTSAASIPLALAEADAAGRFHAGDRLLLVGFGAGTTWGGVALEWAPPPPAASP